VWPPPPYVQVRITWAPNTGVHLFFYRADGRSAAAVDHLSEMLGAAREIVSLARDLPEMT
jgi:hypothetical protein